MEQNDEKYMQRCLQLARLGLGTTYPNPMVGCVIVFDGKVIGEGWHQKAGGPHAEVRAVASVEDKGLLRKSVIYVNLEPCSHHGRTPPCADLIVKHNIPRVVIGSLDENHKVSGNGVKRLEEHGCEVLVGVLEDQCRELNRRFFTFHRNKRPYVILKWAQSRDGFIFPGSDRARKGEPYWITNSLSRQRVHQWRAEEASILIGRKTLEFDNPSLSARDFRGLTLVRIAISKNCSVPDGLKFRDGSQPTYVFCHGQTKTEDGVRFVGIDFEGNVLQQIMRSLHELEVQSLIVEGGNHTLQGFIDSGLWDEARVFVGKSEFKQGIPAPTMSAELLSEEDIDGDRLLCYRPVDKATGDHINKVQGHG
jgi:diaminohydroxyphosphoribosylaminopyrimidine deaminase/5-amino-6-(5-phosphoribosylamino)uracil reductase